MCSIAAVAIGTTIGSTLLSVGGQYVQMQAQSSAAKASASYNAQVAANEEATRMQLAQNEVARGAAERSKQQRQAARQMGAMRAGMGASGFQMDDGTMLSLLGESAEEHQYDTAVIQSNTNQAAWQHMVGATAAQNSRTFANWQGSNADSGRLGSYLGMGGSLLGGIGSAMGMYNRLSGTNTPKKGDGDLGAYPLGG